MLVACETFGEVSRAGSIEWATLDRGPIPAVPVPDNGHHALCANRNAKACLPCRIDSLMLELHQEMPLAGVDPPHLHAARPPTVDGDPVARPAIDAPIRRHLPSHRLRLDTNCP